MSQRFRISRRRALEFGAALTATLFWPVDCAAQQELGGAKVTTENGSLTVSAASGRPLYYALVALSETYGWAVDYEDPIYSGAEVRDATDPKWLQEHPIGRRFYEPADHRFSASLGNVNGGNPEEFDLVNKLVELYNRTSDPGSFQLIRTSQGRFSVSGQSHSQTSSFFTRVLDRQMLPSSNRESASDALQTLATQCGSAAGVSIGLGTVPSNALATSYVERHEGPLNCREQLGRILAALPHPARYALLYDINSRAYYLNVVTAHRLVVGPDGQMTVAPI
jgi:hypothetical protein